MLHIVALVRRLEICQGSASTSGWLVPQQCHVSTPLSDMASVCENHHAVLEEATYHSTCEDEAAYLDKLQREGSCLVQPLSTRPSLSLQAMAARKKSGLAAGSPRLTSAHMLREASKKGRFISRQRATKQALHKNPQH